MGGVQVVGQKKTRKRIERKKREMYVRNNPSFVK